MGPGRRRERKNNKNGGPGWPSDEGKEGRVTGMEDQAGMRERKEE